MESAPVPNKEEESKASEIHDDAAKDKVLEQMPDVINLTIEDGKPTPDIESMCMYCHNPKGVTRFM